MKLLRDFGVLFPLSVLLSSVSESGHLLDHTLVPRFIIAAFSCLALLVLFRKQLLPATIPVNLILLTPLIFMAYGACSITWSHTLTEGIFDILKIVCSFIFFLLGIHYFKSSNKKAFERMSYVSIIILIVEIIAVVIQTHKTDFQTKDSIYQISGINSHKNLASSFIFLNSIFFFINYKNVASFKKAVYITCVICSALLLVYLKTKAVALGIITAGVVYSLLFLYRKFKPRLSVLTIGISLIVLFNIGFVLLKPIVISGIQYNSSIKEQKNQSTQIELDNERLVLWSKTFGILKDKPFLGCGLGSWQIDFQKQSLSGLWRAEDLNYTFQRPHNDWLWILSESGWVGFNLFLLSIISLISYLLKSFGNAVSENSNTGSHRVIQICLSFLAGFAVIAFFDFPKERVEHLLFLNLILAVSYNELIKFTIPKTLLSIRANYVYYPGIALLLFCLLVGYKRAEGEYYTQKMYVAKSYNAADLVIRNGEKAINRYYSIDPTSIPVNWYIGNAYAQTKDYNIAFKEFQKAYSLSPYNRNVVNDYASAFMMLNQPDSAIKYYQYAAELSPRFDDPKLNLVAIYISKREFKKADSCLKSLLHDSDRRTHYQTIVDSYLSR